MMGAEDEAEGGSEAVPLFAEPAGDLEQAQAQRVELVAGAAFGGCRHGRQPTWRPARLRSRVRPVRTSSTAIPAAVAYASRPLSGDHVSELPAACATDWLVPVRVTTKPSPAVDAAIEPSGLALDWTPSHDGIAVQRHFLAARILRMLRDPNARHVALVPTRVLRPHLSTARLAYKYQTYITIDRAHFRLRLWKNLRLARTYTIAVGRQGLETPAGQYEINDRQVNPSWHVPNSAWAGDLAGRVIPPGPDDPIKARWLGFYNGAGIHGTDEISSLGTAASHGCIRMSIPDVEQLYPLVPLHTPIYVG